MMHKCRLIRCAFIQFSTCFYMLAPRCIETNLHNCKCLRWCGEEIFFTSETTCNYLTTSVDTLIGALHARGLNGILP